MEIPVELSQIIINEQADQQVVVVRELKGDRSFPIVIGMMEILAIDRRLKEIDLPRPMTHDLLESVIVQLDATIRKVVINDLRDHTFFARIYLTRGGNTVEIDSRPSDALALCAGLNIPLFVEERVFEQLGMEN